MGSTTVRGRPSLIVDGYEHRFDRASRDGLFRFYRCVNGGCRGRARADAADRNGVITTAHAHEPNPDAIVIRKHRSQLKAAARTSRDSPRDLLMSHVVQGAAAGVAPSRSADMRCIERQRLLQGREAVDVANAQLVQIAGDFQLTEAGERFLLYDSQADAPGDPRVIVFCSALGLELLWTGSDVWGSDGTFKSCPMQFREVYTVHSMVEGSALPCVFALMEDRSANSYRLLFRSLRRNLPGGFIPSRLIIDFETAVDVAFRDVYPGVETSFCLFHFSQNVYRKVQSLGLQGDYQRDDEVRKFLRSVAALAFLPTHRVGDGYRQLLPLARTPATRELMQYMFTTYVGGIDGNGANVEPLFRVESWNVHARVLEGAPRTTNGLEGWHHAFNQSAGIHPSVSKLIKVFRREEANVRNRWTAYRLRPAEGLRYKPAARAVGRTNEQISTLCERFGQEQPQNVIPFLNAISHYLHF